MFGDVRRAGWTGAWVAIALCALSGCSAAPANPAASAGTNGSVADAVRALTDRSAARRDVVTLSNGMRMKRVSLPNGYSHVVVGRMGADGQPSLSCVDNAPAAESFLAGGQRGNGQ
jgi:hypothetical protein